MEFASSDSSSSGVGYNYDYGSQSFSYYGSEGSINDGSSTASSSGSSSSSSSSTVSPEMKLLYEIIVGIYSGLMVLLLAAFLWQLKKREGKFKSVLVSAQGGISIFMFLFLAVRITYFSLYSFSQLGSWLLYLNRIALLLLFTVFSLVLFRWVHSLERKFNKPTMFVATIVLIVFILNVVTYTIEITAIVLTLHNEVKPSHESQNKYGRFAAFFMGLTYSFVAACFFIYGWRFLVLIARFKKARQKLNRQAIHHQPGRSMIFGGTEKHEEGVLVVDNNNNNSNQEWETHLKLEICKMMFFTVLFTFCFGLRGFFWIYNSIHQMSWLITNTRTSTIVSYLVPEIPVSLAAIWISRGKWRPLPASDKHFTPHIVANPDVMQKLSVNSPLLYKGEAEVLFDD